MRRFILIPALVLATAVLAPAQISAQPGSQAGSQPVAPANAPANTPAGEVGERAVDKIAPSGPSFIRHALVKAAGRGQTAEEAEHSALKAARALAATRYADLGGPAALADASHDRILAQHHSPPLGFSDIGSTALVEIRLRPFAEPLRRTTSKNQTLFTLDVRMDQGTVMVTGSLPAEVLLAFEQPDGRVAGVLPGGGASWRLIPGKPLRQPMVPVEPGGKLHVLACTGGIGPAAAATNISELLAKARAGKPRPAQVQGVVSECVEAVLRIGSGSARGMRQKGTEAPVNMTGAAGRESGFPVPAGQN